ncbi:MAG TPA: CARDB domain-containing protein [archaeon]|nr:CARDB domain-containing protein [archaeon]
MKKIFCWQLFFLFAFFCFLPSVFSSQTLAVGSMPETAGNPQTISWTYSDSTNNPNQHFNLYYGGTPGSREHFIADLNLSSCTYSSRYVWQNAGVNVGNLYPNNLPGRAEYTTMVKKDDDTLWRIWAVYGKNTIYVYSIKKNGTPNYLNSPYSLFYEEDKTAGYDTADYGQTGNLASTLVYNYDNSVFVQIVSSPNRLYRWDDATSQWLTDSNSLIFTGSGTPNASYFVGYYNDKPYLLASDGNSSWEIVSNQWVKTNSIVANLPSLKTASGCTGSALNGFSEKEEVGLLAYSICSTFPPIRFVAKYNGSQWSNVTTDFNFNSLPNAYPFISVITSQAIDFNHETYFLLAMLLSSGDDVRAVMDNQPDTFQPVTANPITCSYSWNTTNVSPGDYYVDVNVTNSYGNSIQASSNQFQITAAPEGDLFIEWVKPIQVIEDVNLITDKATVVRVKVINTGSPKVVTAKLSYNGQDYYDTNQIADFRTIDFYPTPYSTSGTYQISAMVDPYASISETNENNNTKTVDLNVTRTYGFKVIYVPVELLDRDLFNFFISHSEEYMKAVYPLPENAIDNREDPVIYGRLSPLEFIPDKGVIFTLHRLYTVEYLAYGGLKSYDRVVGITPNGWLLSNYWQNWSGISSPTTSNSSLSELSAVTPSHEVGHTFGLCDEITIGGDCGRPEGCSGCPNPDPNGQIVNGFWVDCNDSWCGNKERINAASLMSYQSGELGKWIAKDEYTHLLNLFMIPHTEPEQVLLLSGTVDKNNTVELDPWYLVDGYPSEIEAGPYSIQVLDSNEQVLNDINFNVNFLPYANPPIDTNVTAFVFAIPYNTDTNKVIVKYDGLIKAERQISSNAPTVTITSPTSEDIWTGINSITWNSSDLDGDNLSYVLEYSSDNGATWNPLAIGITDTNYSWNADFATPSNNAKIKIIATDGVLTSEAVSDNFIVRNPDISIQPFLWDFGSITKGEMLSQDFNITNTGNADLNIFNINSPPEIDISGLSVPLTLAPGESHIFSATLNTQNLSGNYFSDMNIGSNDPDENSKRAFVQGAIQTLQPTGISWILGYGGNKRIGQDYNIIYSILSQPTKKLVSIDYNVLIGWN